MESYVYKKEVDWSLLTEGLTLPIKNQIVFGKIMNRFLEKGENKNIILILEGKAYKAEVRNVKFDKKFNRKSDTLQIRYPRDGELANALKGIFSKSYSYIRQKREMREPGDRRIIRLPENQKEFLVFYTTEYDDTYLLESIVADDVCRFAQITKLYTERAMEETFNYDVTDNNAGIYQDARLMKIRKLNKSIGDNLKLVYDYQCQICNRRIGDQYDCHVVEAHHIDYFIKSLNNDANNQLIICPNHHSIIHEVNPVFNRKSLAFIYPNGYRERLALNLHL